MKKIGLIGTGFVVGAIIGIFGTAYWGEKVMKEAELISPEAYSELEGPAERRVGEIRIEKLDIADNVHKYHESVELVAFAPGSGWIRFKTRDGITPTISFFKATEEEVQKFNQFAISIGEPIRVSLSGGILSITAEETMKDLMRFAGKGDVSEKNRLKGFYYQEPLPMLAIRKDSSGKIFLVKASDKDKKGRPTAVALQKE